MHCKFNWFTVAIDRTQHRFYIIQNVNINSFTKQFQFICLQTILMGIEKLYDAKQIHAKYNN